MDKVAKLVYSRLTEYHVPPSWSNILLHHWTKDRGPIYLDDLRPPLTKEAVFIEERFDNTFLLRGHHKQTHKCNFTIEINFNQPFLIQNNIINLSEVKFHFRGKSVNSNAELTINNPDQVKLHLQNLQKMNYKRRLRQLFRDPNNELTTSYGVYDCKHKYIKYLNEIEDTLMVIDLVMTHQNKNKVCWFAPCKMIFDLFMKMLMNFVNESKGSSILLIHGFFREIKPDYCRTHDIKNIVSEVDQRINQSIESCQNGAV